MQLMAVVSGGTLHQHLPDLLGHDRHRAAPGTDPLAADAAAYGRHDVVIRPGSRAHRLLGSHLTVNSFHHQAVDDPGTLHRDRLVPGRPGHRDHRGSAAAPSRSASSGIPSAPATCGSSPRSTRPRPLRAGLTRAALADRCGPPEAQAGTGGPTGTRAAHRRRRQLPQHEGPACGSALSPPQPMFFVATAPSGPDGHVMSPRRGMTGTFLRVLGEHRVVPIWTTTAAVSRRSPIPAGKNGRDHDDVLRVVRTAEHPSGLHGTGRHVLGHLEPDCTDLPGSFAALAGHPRAAWDLFVVDVHRGQRLVRVRRWPG